MDDDDFGYEIGQDDLRELSRKSSSQYYQNDDDFGYEIGQDDLRELSRKNSSQYYQNDDELNECKLLRDILNKLDYKLNLLKAKCTAKPDATVFAVAESMRNKLDEFLKMKDAYQRREVSEENLQTMTDAETEKDAIEKNLKDGNKPQLDESFKEDKLQLNSAEELKEGKVEADADAVADLKGGRGGELQ